MNVYFMRHGETDWNTVKRLQGRTDIPLNANGSALAERVSCAVHKSNIHFDRVYTSPLVRAVQTAELMNVYSRAPLVRDERIAEFCFGAAEGVTLSAVLTEPRYAWLKAWFQTPEAYRAEGGAESMEQFFARIGSFLDTLRALEAEAAAAGSENRATAYDRNVLVVCHGGVVRGLLCCMNGGNAAAFADAWMPNCSLNLAVLKNGVFSIKYTARVFAE